MASNQPTTPLKSRHHYEQTFRERFATKRIVHLLKRYGINVKVIRTKTPLSASQHNTPTNAQTLADAAREVFGDHSGLSPAVPAPPTRKDTDPSENVSFTGRILLITVPLNPTDAANSGMLEKQVLYTFDDILPGDRIVIESDDGSKKSGIVGQKNTWGITTTVYRQFDFLNLGDADPI